MSIERYHISELLGPYVRGELDEGRAREVEEHLPTCGECRAELDAVEALQKAEPDPLTEIQRASIRRALPSRPPTVSGWRNPGALVAVAAVIAVLLVGFLYVGLSGSGGSGEAASSGGGSTRNSLGGQAKPAFSKVTFDPSGGTFTTPSLRKLAASGAFRSAVANHSSLGSAPAPRPVPKTKTAGIAACARQVSSAQGNSPALVYAATGKDEKGRPATALGFAYSAGKHSKPDHYAFWVWQQGKCASTPELYLSGTLGH
jgi:hypothetical protein